MNRGEVWDYKPSNGSPIRVVILSNDEHNAVGWPVCAYLMRRRSVASPNAVPLSDPDPVGGSIDLSTMGTINPERLSGPVGMLTGATVSRLGEAIRAFLDV